METSTKILYRNIEVRYTKVTWTHKIQEKQADIYIQKSKCIKKLTCWLTVITAGGALASLSSFIPVFSLCGIAINIPVILTTVLPIILSYLTLRYGDGVLDTKAKDNRQYAAKVHNLRNLYESLMYEIKANRLSDDDIVHRRNDLEKQENLVYSEEAPYTSKKANGLAEKALKIDKESTTEEEEIEAIVPKDLQL